MEKEPSIVKSILQQKCPNCRQGDLFQENNPLKLKHIFKMNDYCPSCGFKQEIEPSFFYGAMYINYALGVGQAIVTFIITFFGFGLRGIELIIAIFAVLLLTFPFSLRWSRILWSYMFVGYQSFKKNEINNEENNK